MSMPVTKSYYCTTGSFSGSGFALLTETQPLNFAATAFGWNVGQNNPPLFCEMNRAVEVVRTSTQWQATPTASIPNNNAAGSGASNSWAFGPLQGEFLSGSWQITMSVKAQTNANNQRGNFVYRFWKGYDISGSGAILIDPTYFSSSINRAVTGGAGVAVIHNLSASVPLSGIILRNEYVFIQTIWSIFATSGNNGADEDIVFGSASFISTTPFIEDHPQFVSCKGCDDD